VRRALVALLIVAALAGCGDDDDDTGGTANNIAGPEPAADVTAGAYADDWNALSQSLHVAPVDSDKPSTDSGNWQVRLDPSKSDIDEGWALMQDFGAKFDCDLPDRQPRDDILVISC
jgi:hypothetical protein